MDSVEWVLVSPPSTQLGVGKHFGKANREGWDIQGHVEGLGCLEPLAQGVCYLFKGSLLLPQNISLLEGVPRYP